ncbi:MAG TPA: glycosyltransferase [Thermoleophilia bacterium]|nr:glycosyltransferase [Thermoleophilia bacterium]
MTSSTAPISVVIPTYNRRDSVLRLLADVHRQEGADFEVIVVDDRSPDGTAAAIAREYPHVKILVNSVNGGPSVSRNRGIREASGEFIIGLDSDVTLGDTALFRRVAATLARCPDATMLALRVMAPDGSSDDAKRWCHPFPIDPFADMWVWTDYFSGTGYAGRRAAMMRAGLFPEIVFMDYEEVELSYRILDDGGAILHCPHLKVLHHAGSTAQHSRVRTYYHPRNQILLAAGIFPPAEAITYLVPRTSYQFLVAVRGHQLRVFCSALRDAFILLPARMKERRPLRADTLRRIRALHIRPVVAVAPDGESEPSC